MAEAARGRLTLVSDQVMGRTPREISLVSDQVINLGWDGWRVEPRDRHGRWTKLGAGEVVQALRGSLGTHPVMLHPGDSGQVGHLMTRSADSVPGMFGGHTHLDWDGKPPTIFADDSDPGTIAEIDWKGHVRVQATAARNIAQDLADQYAPVQDPQSFTVPFHELIHAVLPAGQHRDTNGDKKAYQESLASADIEEGFTELGTIQHAPDYFDQIGIGDRRVLDKGSLDKQQHLADINGEQFTPDLTATKTMNELADERSTPEAIRSGNSWGHYKPQVTQAYNWVSTIAQMHTGQDESSEATQNEILRMSDEVNAVGTAEKPRVMASHVTGDMMLDQSMKEAVLSNTAQTLLSEWETSSDTQQVVAHARSAALQQVQALRVQSERAAA